jgi:hypothetical protein
MMFSIPNLTQLNSLVRLFRNHRSLAHHHPKDVSHAKTPFPPETDDTFLTLEAIGFKQLGQIAIHDPTFSPQPKIRWILVNADKTVIAELAVQASITTIRFRSVYQDDMLIETCYPIGDHIVRPYHRSRRVLRNLETAWHKHQQAMTELTAVHGSAFQFNSMPDVLDFEVMYRGHHLKRRLRAELSKELLMTIYLLNATMLAAIAIFDIALFGDIFRNVLVSILVIGIIPIGILKFTQILQEQQSAPRS